MRNVYIFLRFEENLSKIYLWMGREGPTKTQLRLNLSNTLEPFKDKDLILKNLLLSLNIFHTV